MKSFPLKHKEGNGFTRLEPFLISPTWKSEFSVVALKIDQVSHYRVLCGWNI